MVKFLLNVFSNIGPGFVGHSQVPRSINQSLTFYLNDIFSGAPREGLLASKFNIGRLLTLSSGHR